MSTIGERIRFVRQSITPVPSEAKFAELLGTDRSNLHKYEIGDTTPKDTLLKLLSLQQGINYKWLKTGEGRMRKRPGEPDVDSIVARYHLDENQKHILESFISLDQSEQESVFKLTLLMFKKIYL